MGRQASSFYAPPTAREIALLLTLLIFLLVTTSNLTGSLNSSKLSDYPFQSPSAPHRNPTNANNTREPKRFETVVSWKGSQKVPDTVVVAHAPGWTILDRLYALNGTLYIVTDDPASLPEKKFMISTALRIANGPVEAAKRIPTDREMQFISTADAKTLFGSGADVLDGVTWYANDPSQFITHYYHWSAELFFGFWRTYSSLDPSITEDGNTTLPTPRRMLFPHLDADHWRDYAKMNQLVVRTSFPSILMEYKDDWADRMSTGRPTVFDRVVLADRASAINGVSWQRTQRTASEAFALPGSAHWWSAVRNSVVGLSGLVTPRGGNSNPVITYISRQDWGRRMLIPEDHEKLVEELYVLRDTYGYEVNVVSMDKLSRMEQLHLAGRSTIMMGVHGNGLTSLVWMKPTARSTVMEFFYPEGFAHDYEWTTRALGMVHYGFWGNRTFTSPEIPPVNYPEGFQGNEIPIDGALVARICLERLNLVDEADD